MSDERISKLQAMLDDEAFVDRLAEANSPDELKEILTNNGLEFSDDEIKVLRQGALNALAADGELNEGDVDAVAGGIGIGTAALLIGGSYVAGRLYGKLAGKKLGYCWK